MHGEITEKLLRINDVLRIIPVGKSTFYAWVQEGKAPQPIRFGSRCSMWRYSDIEAFIAAHTNDEEGCHE
ncbi:TPA: AlpA family phage regulatory protein [Klebsiella pneumoniae]|nr:AlpA family phage regulatory protein [Klebsiella pneumoniae]HEL6185623.1 AlpA family phage regulatory protein [Klebsiella pneumoniae]HEL6188530.1 AlpA family phage regulatory protein [Klebsiella pneumoniae]HEL7772627.1 AlpA family phage regulatory protein [Klebsiella pneumoniae]HEL7777190.1 AlpA family phage regulatory protein [Klebsiella pneumoniae]